MGRPSKRTPEREARLLEALRAGNTRKAACHYAGISDECLARWLDRYVDFVDAIRKAEGDAEVRMVAQIAHAAQSGTWQAAAWWLERRRPLEFGRPYLPPDGNAELPPMRVTVVFDRADQTETPTPTLTLNGHTA